MHLIIRYILHFFNRGVAKIAGTLCKKPCQCAPQMTLCMKDNAKTARRGFSPPTALSVSAIPFVIPPTGGCGSARRFFRKLRGTVPLPHG